MKMKFYPTVISMMLLLLAPAVHAEHPLVRYTFNGDIDSLRIVAERMQGSPEGKLAAALATDNVHDAIPVYKRITREAELPIPLQAIAWQRLYGYASLINEPALVRDAATWLHEHGLESVNLFHNGLPEKPTDRAWSVQIGAFSSRRNADRLAGQQRDLGYTVQVDEIPAIGKTLYAVRVGRFAKEDEAKEFADRVFGSSGAGYRLVMID